MAPIHWSYPCADPDEQRAIAAFLDRETARIDALVAKKERLIELLQEQAHCAHHARRHQGLDPNAPMKETSRPGDDWVDLLGAVGWRLKHHNVKLDDRKNSTVQRGECRDRHYSCDKTD